MNWKDRLSGFAEQIPYFKPMLAVILVAGFLAFYWDQKSTGEETQKQAELEVSTLIPEGYVLVPIEVANSESVDSILGNFGVVDLYLPPDETRKNPIKIAARIKILRAPLNPSRFAVLAREEESARIVSYAHHLHVVIQNPELSGTESESGKKREDQKPVSTMEEKTNRHRSQRNSQQRRSRIFVESVHVENQ